MARLGFLGTGEIAAALVEALSGAGHVITVSTHGAEIAATLSERFAEVTVADNAAVVAGSDVVFVCLLADVARDVLPALIFRDDQTVISVMAGVDLAALAALYAPATDLAITIPLPTITTGLSPLAVYPENAAVTDLFGVMATVLPMADEIALNAHFAVTGLLAGLLEQVDIAALWLAGFTGDRAGAEAYLGGLLESHLHLLRAPGTDITALQAGLATEGGLSATMRTHLAARGVPQAIANGRDGLRPRLGLPEA